MLESLRIENLILIRRAEIHFDKGLNILTGETGSGKSAILTAIRLLSGEKADPQLLYNPAFPAIVEGEIRFRKLDLLDLDLSCNNETCTLRREILPSGKSRAFFNDRLINIGDLRKLAAQAIEFADQHGAREILSSSSQRTLLDLWAGVDLSSLSYEKQVLTTSELNRLKDERKNASLSMEFAQQQLKEIEEINWKKGEEETLADEHKKQASAIETMRKLSSIQSELSETTPSSHLRKMANSIPQNEHLLKEAASLLASASLEILEAERLIEKILEKFELDPRRLEAIEQRIAQIERIKRKYGRTVEEVEERSRALKDQIAQFEGIDERIESLQSEYARLAKENQEIAASISLHRREKSHSLQELFLKELHSLYLPHARFEISLTEKPLGADGCDNVRFLFSANPGQPLQPIEECASGGEQSRIFFALKSIMAKKEERDCLVLDEIDSNVGGIAASVLGQKLKTLGEERQLICITHFVQAARHASRHFLVEKNSSIANAVTTIRPLNSEERESEYKRMAGETA